MVQNGYQGLEEKSFYDKIARMSGFAVWHRFRISDFRFRIRMYKIGGGKKCEI